MDRRRCREWKHSVWWKRAHKACGSDHHDLQNKFPFDRRVHSVPLCNPVLTGQKEWGNSLQYPFSHFIHQQIPNFTINSLFVVNSLLGMCKIKQTDPLFSLALHYTLPPPKLYHRMLTLASRTASSSLCVESHMHSNPCIATHA